MTRLPADGGEKPPLRRIANGGEHGDLMLELSDRVVTIRPKGTRSPGLAATITWGVIYQRALLAAIDAEKRRGR